MYILADGKEPMINPSLLITIFCKKLMVHGKLQMEKYSGDRSHGDLKAFVAKMLGDEAGKQKEDEDADGPRSPVVVLTTENFENAIEQGYTFVKFFAPW